MKTVKFIKNPIPFGYAYNFDENVSIPDTMAAQVIAAGLAVETSTFTEIPAAFPHRAEYISAGIYSLELLKAQTKDHSLGPKFKRTKEILAAYYQEYPVFDPDQGLTLKEEGDFCHLPYQQNGNLRININLPVPKYGFEILPIIRDGNPITIFVGASEITTIGKVLNSSDFDTVIGNVDEIYFSKRAATADNPTGVYYRINNLG